MTPGRGLVVGVAAVLAAGGLLVAGRVSAPDGGRDGATARRCLVQTPVSDHVEPVCVPAAEPLLGVLDEPSSPPGSHSEGWVQVGDVWLDQSRDPARLCWVDATGGTWCDR